MKLKQRIDRAEAQAEAFLSARATHLANRAVVTWSITVSGRIVASKKVLAMEIRRNHRVSSSS